MQNVQEIADQTAPAVPYSRNFVEFVRTLPGDSEVILHGQTWQDYEELLEEVGENPGLHIAFDGSTLQIMTLSTTHEKISILLEKIIFLISLRQGIDIEAFGSSTIKLSEEMKGLEPDACYYIQSVELIGGRSDIDFSVDPMPDVAVEIDLYNTSLNKFSIYSSLGIPEVWRYFHDKFEFYKLEEGVYVQIDSSAALPLLTADVLSGFLNRGREEKQSAILRDFEKWLDRQQA